MPAPKKKSPSLFGDNRRWRLPRDTSVVSVRELPEDVQKTIFGDGPIPREKYCLERKNARTLPKIINENVAAVLRLFDTEGTCYTSVLDALSESMGMATAKVDKELKPLVKRLIHSNLLVEVSAAEAAETSLTASLNPGDRWCDYIVEEQIKIMIDSEIHRVRSTSSEIVRVLKIARATYPNTDMKAVITERLQHEFAVLKQMDHPYIVTVHESGVSDGRTYGILDYADGPSVRSLLTDDRQTPDDAAILAYALQCTEALEAVHDAGYLHGDVHTGNFLTKDDNICLIDFGLSRPIRVKKGDEAKYHQGGVVLYMPPESIRQKGKKKKRLWGSVAGEVYSCGVILFSMFTRRYPYVWTTYRDDYEQNILHEPPLSFEACQRRPWPELEAVLHRALAKDPRERYRSMGSFRRALQRIAPTAVRGSSPFYEQPLQPSAEVSGDRP